MRREARLATAACVTVLFGSALAGCITVFPAKDAVTSDPRAGNIPYLPVIGFEHQVDPDPGPCASGTDSATIFVPQLAKSVTADIHVKMSSAQPIAQDAFQRHVDFTLADPSGIQWVDLHLQNNGTDKKLVVNAPQAGGWSASLVWKICDIDPLFNDDLHITVIVTQPA